MSVLQDLEDPSPLSGQAIGLKGSSRIYVADAGMALEEVCPRPPPSVGESWPTSSSSSRAARDQQQEHRGRKNCNYQMTQTDRKFCDHKALLPLEQNCQFEQFQTARLEGECCEHLTRRIPDTEAEKRDEAVDSHSTKHCDNHGNIRLSQQSSTYYWNNSRVSAMPCTESTSDKSDSDRNNTSNVNNNNNLFAMRCCGRLLLLLRRRKSSVMETLFGDVGAASSPSFNNSDNNSDCGGGRHTTVSYSHRNKSLAAISIKLYWLLRLP